MKKVFTPGLLVVSLLIILAAVARFFTPIPNFTPIAAMALFGGAYFSKKYWAFLVPLAALAISDFFIGTYDATTMIAVYASFILVGVIGTFVGRKINVTNVVLGALSSSVLFFLITNFGTWLSGFCGYPMTFSGLILCYEMGLPFFRNEIFGTLVYSGVLFGAFELAKRRFPALATI